MAKNTLTTDRLLLVPFEARHLTETYVGWLNDKQHMRFSEQRHRDHTIASCRAYVASFERSPNHLWAIEHDGQHVGNISVSIDANNGVADIGLLVGRDCAGKGYGGEAWTAVLQWLLAQPHIRKVTGGCLRPNQGMIAIMEHASMQPDGVRHDHYIVDGEPVDVVYYCAFSN